MPLDLPGFYWDEERNRYFPISSKPVTKPATTRTRKQKQKSENVDGSQYESVNNQRRKNIPDLLQARHRSQLSYAENSRIRHELWCSQVKTTSRVQAYDSEPSIYGNITAYCAFSGSRNGSWRSLIGDNLGWLYGLDNETERWTTEMNLHPSCQVSSISTSGNLFVATSFGTSSKIVLKSFENPERTTLLSLKHVHDIWTSDLDDCSLLLGANRKAVLMRDIESQSVEFLDTKSDVFTVQQRKNLVYTGSRNGTINRFDTRTCKPDALFEDRFHAIRSSVVHLHTVGDSIFVSQLNGMLCSYDLRFSGRSTAPIMMFQGHVNSITQRLGVAVDSVGNFLFAAGEDGVIRGWSTRTGENTFSHQFQGGMSIPSIQLDDDGCLWAGTGKTLHQFYIGQKG